MEKRQTALGLSKNRPMIDPFIGFSEIAVGRGNLSLSATWFWCSPFMREVVNSKPTVDGYFFFGTFSLKAIGTM